MLQYDFEESVGYWIFSTTHGMQQLMNERLAELGITYRQWEVLVWLSFAGECAQSALAERMMIEPPTLVGVLDRMERDGWIERVPDEKDGRKKIIRVTDQVEPVWTKMVRCAQEVRAQAIDGISESELRTVKEVLQRIRQNLAGDQPVDQLKQSPQQMIPALPDPPRQ